MSLVLPEVNTELMSLFLAAVARHHANPFLPMVLDGAGGHVAGARAVPARRRLLRLPPRSPEPNPAEHWWAERREQWLCHRLFDCQQAVDAQVARGLAALAGDAPRVASLCGVEWITNLPLEAP